VGFARGDEGGARGVRREESVLCMLKKSYTTHTRKSKTQDCRDDKIAACLFHLSLLVVCLLFVRKVSQHSRRNGSADSLRVGRAILEWGEMREIVRDKNKRGWGGEVRKEQARVGTNLGRGSLCEGSQDDLLEGPKRSCGDLMMVGGSTPIRPKFCRVSRVEYVSNSTLVLS